MIYMNLKKMFTKKRIIAVAFGVLIVLILFACKKEEEETPKKCDVSSYSGKWLFVMNSGQANQRNDTLKLQWNGSAYVINGFTLTQSEDNKNIYFESDMYGVYIVKESCDLYTKGVKGTRL